MKIFKYLLYTLLITSLITLLSAFLFSYFYGDKIKSYVILEINKQLDTEINVKEVNFSVFYRFPYASIKFEEVSAKSVKKDSTYTYPTSWEKQLFQAREIYLQFNIIDLLRRNYKVKKVEIVDSKINLLIDKNGKDNFHFWKNDEQNSSDDSLKMNFNLKSVELRNCAIDYDDTRQKTQVKLIIKSSETSLNAENNSYAFIHENNFTIEEIKVEKKIQIKNLPLNIRIDGLWRNSESQLVLTNSTLTINEIKTILDGKITYQEKFSDYDLKMKISKLELESIKQFVSDTVLSKMESYSFKGLAGVNATFKGKWYNKQFPLLTVQFTITDASISEINSNLELENININGEFHNNSQRSLQAWTLRNTKFHAKSELGEIDMNFSLSNFETPFLKAKIKTRLDLEKVNQFLRTDSLNTLNGNLMGDLVFEGPIKNYKTFSKSDLDAISVQGLLTFSNISSKLKNSKFEFSEMQGQLNFNKEKVTVDSLRATVQGNTLQLKGELINLIPYYLSSDELLIINADLKSDKIILDNFFYVEEVGSTNDTTFHVGLSNRIKSELDISVIELHFKKFEATNVRGVFNLDKQVAAFTNLSFASMEGNVTGRCIIDAAKIHTIQALVEVDIKKINVNTLFVQLENFGQNTLQASNLKGFADANIAFSGAWTDKLEVKPSEIIADIDLEITKGELIDFKPMLSLSKFVSVDELKNIKFATLKNSIHIRDQKTIIPEMIIKSNALNILFSGSHSFNNEIDYHFKLSMNELLSGKAKRNKQDNIEFGEIEEDGLGKLNLFVKMTGTTDNPVISYDKKSLRNKYKEDTHREKQEIRKLLNEEFGWFGNKDKSVEPKTKAIDESIKMEWEETKTPESQTNKPKESAPIKTDVKKKNKLLDKITKDKKPETQENSDDFN